MVPTQPSVLTFTGHVSLRQRLVLATLSGKAVLITHIRDESDDHTGLTDYEASFVRLLEKVTNGSKIEINYTGTSITYIPGIINGGSIVHDCPTSRAVGYFIEPLLALAPFAKTPLDLLISGVTNDNVDISVDLIRTLLLPSLARFGLDHLEMKILKRGARPNGGGRVHLKLPTIRTLTPLNLTSPGLVTKIRGIAYCTRISPLMANRMQEAARSILTRFIPDVYIYTDVFKGDESGNSPGYALSLVAETDTKVLFSTECAYRLESNENPAAESKISSDAPPFKKTTKTSKPDITESVTEYLANDYHFQTPEHLGIQAARQLLTEIKKGGTIDSVSQWFIKFNLGIQSLTQAHPPVHRSRSSRCRQNHTWFNDTFHVTIYLI